MYCIHCHKNKTLIEISACTNVLCPRGREEETSDSGVSVVDVAEAVVDVAVAVADSFSSSD